MLVAKIIIPWNRVLCEKLTVAQLIKKFRALCQNRRLITISTKVHEMSLYQAKLIQSTPSHPTPLMSILILPYHLHLGLSSGLFPSGLPTKTPHDS
jgi:hypothetical protein